MSPPKRPGGSWRYTLCRQDLREAPKSAMGGDPDGTWAAANQPRDGLDIQAGDDPQGDDLCLKWGKLSNQFERCLGVQVLEHELCRVGRRRLVGVGCLCGQGGSSPGTAPALVDRAAPRGREHPSP